MRETLLEFGEGQRLFGVLTEPARPKPGLPAVCLLNVGANPQVGPHRLNVSLARTLAARGHVTLRFDAAGLGDSAAAEGSAENQIYSLAAVADVQTALTLVTRLCQVDRFVLIGLCSGAFVAFHTAVSDRRVVGQVLLSPHAFEWQSGDPVKPLRRERARAFRSTRFYLRALLDPQAWRLVLSGEVDLLGIGGGLLDRFQQQLEQAVPAMSALLRQRRRPQSPIERSFRNLCDRGVATLMVLSFEDGGLEMVGRYLGRDARRLRGRPGFALQILEGLDHTFTAIASQQRLSELLDAYFSTRFGTARLARASPAPVAFETPLD